MDTTVTELMLAAFPSGRPPRSTAYKEGLQAKLRNAIEKLQITCRYTEGTAEFDAFYAGLDEGRYILKGAQQ